MGIKQYLKQAFTIDRFIKAKKTRIQYLKDQLEWLGSLPTNTKVQVNAPKDRLGDTVAVLLDAIVDTEREIKRLADLQQDIAELIAKVEQGDLQLVLYERYVNFKKWEDIAMDNNYSAKHVLKLHGKALRAVSEKWILNDT